MEEGIAASAEGADTENAVANGQSRDSVGEKSEVDGGSLLDNGFERNRDVDPIKTKDDILGRISQSADADGEPLDKSDVELESNIMENIVGDGDDRRTRVKKDGAWVFGHIRG